MLFSSTLDQTLHDQQVAEDRLDAERTQLEYEEFCQAVTEFAATHGGFAIVLRAVAAALQATDEIERRR